MSEATTPEFYRPSKRTEAIADVIEELESATAANGPFASPHEGLAIIMEEFDELKEEVWKKPIWRSHEKMRAEAKQLAAMAIRFMIDLTEKR